MGSPIDVVPGREGQAEEGYSVLMSVLMGFGRLNHQGKFIPFKRKKPDDTVREQTRERVRKWRARKSSKGAPAAEVEG